jgi:signal transduction histidine kinase
MTTMMEATTMMTEAMMTEAMTEGRRQVPAMRRITGDVRVRILASYVLLLAVASVISVVVVRQVLLVRLDDRIEEDLAQEVQEFKSLAGGNDPETGRRFGSDSDRIFEVYLERNVPGEGEQLLTIPKRGEPSFRATERADIGFDQALVSRWRTLRDTERGEIDTVAGEARYIALPLVSEGRNVGTFVVAHFTAGEREEVNEAVQIVALVALGVLVLGTAFAFAVSGRVLAPVRHLRDAARQVSGSSLNRRLDVEGDDELADLGRSFNAMLDRLEAAFSSQRDFIRDISHELRTPIAVVRGHIELLSEEDVTEAGDRAATMTLIAGELDRMSRFVDDLLLLAKSEQPDFLQLETVPLDELCEGLESNGSALEPDRVWAVEANSRRSVVADPQRLTQAAINLIRNAIDHTEPGDEIAIGAAVEGVTARIWVRDSGAGIPRAEQGRVFDRFARGGASRRRYEGSGLGLAIVRVIAEVHGGSIELESSPGEGTRFTIVVPVEGPARLDRREDVRL